MCQDFINESQHSIRRALPILLLLVVRGTLSDPNPISSHDIGHHDSGNVQLIRIYSLVQINIVRSCNIEESRTVTSQTGPTSTKQPRNYLQCNLPMPASALMCRLNSFRRSQGFLFRQIDSIRAHADPCVPRREANPPGKSAEMRCSQLYAWSSDIKMPPVTSSIFLQKSITNYIRLSVENSSNSPLIYCSFWYLTLSQSPSGIWSHVRLNRSKESQRRKSLNRTFIGLMNDVIAITMLKSRGDGDNVIYNLLCTLYSSRGYKYPRPLHGCEVLWCVLQHPAPSFIGYH
ncbi:hypothetical protein J6590_001156 [Homalodisca vitripennis]|nr:hypothetical protein J6590_001156 [Homalodisca vitripennis]